VIPFREIVSHGQRGSLRMDSEKHEIGAIMKKFQEFNPAIQTETEVVGVDSFSKCGRALCY
jgi:hypothetical protein